MKVKITVIRKCFFEDLAEASFTDGKEGRCLLMSEGDTFIYEGDAVKPEGLCPWAWIDIYRGVSAISSGATYTPWNNRDGYQILCCTDGVRPVIFSVEKME